MVESSFLAYPCWLEEGHAGPHAAVEIPASNERRRLWLEEQATQQSVSSQVKSPEAGVFDAQVKSSELPPPPPPSMAAGSSPVVLDPSSIKDEAERLQAMSSYLSNLITGMDFNRLPSFIAFWMTSTLAQTSLLALWAVAQQEFDKGAQGVMLTPEFLNKLVPQTLRGPITPKG